MAQLEHKLITRGTAPEQPDVPSQAERPASDGRDALQPGANFGSKGGTTSRWVSGLNP